jgi:hypothetical protein
VLDTAGRVWWGKSFSEQALRVALTRRLVAEIVHQHEIAPGEALGTS